MQGELNGETTARPIKMFGVNVVGAESGNAGITAGRTLPWLQATATVDPWMTWAVTNRDVVILDENNRKIDVYNLTVNDLSNPTNYATLKAKLLAAAK